MNGSPVLFKIISSLGVSLILGAGSAKGPGQNEQPQLAVHIDFTVTLKREDTGHEIVVPKAATCEWIDHLTLHALNVGEKDFVMLSGPATIVKLKEACGSFSAAAVLKEAAQAELSTGSSSSDGWVFLRKH